MTDENLFTRNENQSSFTKSLQTNLTLPDLSGFQIYTHCYTSYASSNSIEVISLAFDIILY